MNKTEIYQKRQEYAEKRLIESMDAIDNKNGQKNIAFA